MADRILIILERRSPFSGTVNQMALPLTEEEFSAGLAAWQAGTLIQLAFPTLSPDQLEFIKTGITPAEWEAEFGGERED